MTIPMTYTSVDKTEKYLNKATAIDIGDVIMLKINLLVIICLIGNKNEIMVINHFFIGEFIMGRTYKCSLIELLGYLD